MKLPVFLVKRCRRRRQHIKTKEIINNANIKEPKAIDE